MTKQNLYGRITDIKAGVFHLCKSKMKPHTGFYVQNIRVRNNEGSL